MDGRELLGATLHGASGTSLEEISEREGLPLGLTLEADAPSTGVLTAFDTASEWLNSPPLTASGLRGRVVLVQFWTYTCINWLRTLSYVRAWYERYGHNGLTVVGVHTPEFGFESDVDNVRRAAKSLDVPYPIVVDSDYAIWTAFENHYWPALYFVGANGHLRGHHFGEGDHERSERTIQRLLTEAGVGDVGNGLVSVDPAGLEVGADWDTLRTPETYVGYERTTNFASPGGFAGGRNVYAIPPRLDLNEWALSGDWTVEGQAATSNESGGRIAFRFHARDLHLVMAPPASGASVPFRVLLDGQPPGADHGTDVNEQGDGAATEPRLYQLVRQRGDVRERTFEIAFEVPGIQVYAFTFG
jgi:thiol-disulfide isomerase/thioredoxin